MASCRAVFAAALCGLGAGALWSWLHHSPVVQLGGHTRRVALRCRLAGSYATVSPVDGLIRLGANSSSSAATRFTMMPVSASSVAALRQVANSYETAATTAKWSGRERLTKSGCNCSGFSNEHGFGRFCHSWELSYQEPWCYVDEHCTGAQRGSFGRYHDVCTSQFQACTPPLHSLEAAPLNYRKHNYFCNLACVELVADQALLDIDQPYTEPEWVAPSGCACSGFANKHGFGSSCRAWEAEHAPWQTPWCYVFDNCTFAKQRGSFGRKHVDCELKATYHERLRLSPPPPSVRDSSIARASSRRLFDPSLGATVASGAGSAASTSIAGSAGGAGARSLRRPMRAARHRVRSARSHAHMAEEAELLARMKQASPPFVAIISEATQGFVTVGMPPDKYELLAHATVPALSASAVFALMPDETLLALGPIALLAACDPADKAAVLCVGYRKRPRDAHRTLLHDVASLGANANAAKFTLEPI